MYYFIRNQIFLPLSTIYIMRHLNKTTILLLALLICSSCCSAHQLDLTVPTQANNSCFEDCCASLPDRPPVTYYYYQNTGRFFGGKEEPGAEIQTFGYSGAGQGYNNPDYQCRTSTGPLPASTYEVAFCKNVMHQSAHRPCSFYLRPLSAFQVCGRDDFFIHGCGCCTEDDSKVPPKIGCSEGCVIISYENRKKIRVGDKLIVMSYDPNKSQNPSQNVVVEQ